MYSARKHFTLSTKILLPMILMLLLAAGVSCAWIVSNLTREHLKESDLLLDSHADAIVDALEASQGALGFDTSGEMVAQLFRDPKFYFNVTTIDGKKIIGSLGPKDDIIAELDKRVSHLRLKDDEIVELNIQNQKWRVISENISIKILEQKFGSNFGLSTNDAPVLNAVTNIDSLYQDISNFRTKFILWGFCFVLLTSIGAAAIIYVTTANLRAFTLSLVDVNPQNPRWIPPKNPSSFEEATLFSHFDQMLTKIRASTESQRLFVASASHELKTPIAALITSLQVTLLKSRSVEEYQNVIRELLEVSEGLKKLSQSLLELTKLDNLPSLEKSPVSIGTVVGDLLEQWKKTAASKGIDIRTNISEPMLEINTNAKLLHIALGNFIDNAIKYSPDHSYIEVSALPESESILSFEIRDQGPGISEDDQKRLGEVFFRANESRPNDLSYGLGFSIAKKILGMLGAVLHVDSSQGKGTRIVVQLHR